MADEFHNKFGETLTYTFWSAGSVFEPTDTDDEYDARFQQAWQPLYDALPRANAIFIFQQAKWDFLPAETPVFFDTSSSGSQS